MLFLSALVLYPRARVRLRALSLSSRRNSNHVCIDRCKHVVDVCKNNIRFCDGSPPFVFRFKLVSGGRTVWNIPDKRKEGGPLETAPYFAQLKPGVRKQVVFYSLTMFVNKPRKA